MRILLLHLLLFSVNSFAQAGSDCGEQAKLAAQNCEARINSARESSVAGDPTAGANGGGVQANAAYQVRNRITTAVGMCESRDLEVCTQKCNAALSDAQSKSNQALIGQIKNNMNSCSNRINAAMSQGNANAAALTQLAAESNRSADQACAEGETCGTQDPNIQQASSSNPYAAINRDSENRCPPGMFFSVRWNQCAGLGTFTPRDMIPGK